MRAPVARTSSISCACRGRSRMHTVMSRTDSSLTLATARMLSAIGAVMSSTCDGVGSDGDLVHVEHRRRVEHRVPIGDRQHRDGVGHALAHQRGAVDRVDGEVAVRPVAVADFLAVVEHRRLVFFALADHHHAAHRHRIDQFAYRVDRRAVAALLVAAPHPAAGCHGAGLGDPYQLQGQVAVWAPACRTWLGARPRGRSSAVMAADCPRSRSLTGAGILAE